MVRTSVWQGVSGREEREADTNRLLRGPWEYKRWGKIGWRAAEDKQSRRFNRASVLITQKRRQISC